MEESEKTQNIDWSVRMRSLSIVILPFVWGVVLFIFMNATSPLRSGPLSVLSFFTLAYLLIVSVLYAATLLTFKVLSIFGLRKSVRRKLIYYLVSVIALGPVFMLALNTLNQLDIKEVLLVIMLLALGCFYVVRRGRREVL